MQQAPSESRPPRSHVPTSQRFVAKGGQAYQPARPVAQPTEAYEEAEPLHAADEAPGLGRRGAFTELLHEIQQ